MPSDVDVLRVGDEAFGRGDIRGITENCDDDIELVGPNSMSGGKVTRGQAFTDTAVVADALGS